MVILRRAGGEDRPRRFRLLRLKQRGDRPAITEVDAVVATVDTLRPRLNNDLITVELPRIASPVRR